MVLSTMIPSALNLGLGGMAWLRGNPGLWRWLLARLPKDRSVGMATRVSVGLALAGQDVVGVMLGAVVWGWVRRGGRFEHERR